MRAQPLLIREGPSTAAACERLSLRVQPFSTPALRMSGVRLAGMELVGRVVATVSGGRVVWEGRAS